MVIEPPGCTLGNHNARGVLPGLFQGTLHLSPAGELSLQEKTQPVVTSHSYAPCQDPAWPKKRLMMADW